MRNKTALGITIAVVVSAAAAAAVTIVTRRRRQRCNGARSASELPLVYCNSETLREAIVRAGIPATADADAGAPITCVPPVSMRGCDEDAAEAHAPDSASSSSSTSASASAAAEGAAYFAIKYYGDVNVAPAPQTWRWLFPQRAASSSSASPPFVNTLALFGAPAVLRAFMQRCTAFVASHHATALVAFESRAMTFAAGVAVVTGLPLIAVHKDNDTCARTPHDATVSNAQSKRYQKRLTLDVNALPADARVVVICDVINTGGTIVAVAELLQKHRACVAGVFTLVDFASCGAAAFLRGAISADNTSDYLALVSL